MQIIYTAKHKALTTDEVVVDGRPDESYEVPARAELILKAVRDGQLGPVVEPDDHGLEPILAVHDPDYVAFLRSAYDESAAYFGEAGPVLAWTFAGRHAARKPQGFMGRKGYYAFGHSTPILAGTWEAAYWSAQCALTAADLVREGQRTSPAVADLVREGQRTSPAVADLVREGKPTLPTVAYALCRPPGHHAAADLYGGYCYLNNAAIAARSLQQSPIPAAHDQSEHHGGEEVAKVAILDVDYHHGNGTQIVFYSDPTVLYCSLHAHPDEEYPYYWGDVDERGKGTGRGTNRNWPLPRGSGEQAYLVALEEALAFIGEFSPRYLVVSVGFDTIEGDPEGGFRLTTGSLSKIGQRIAALGLPTVLIQEGGYFLDRLAESALAFLRPFADWGR
jgi:acetoin utilization deacetylase AcuC-like enzyme